MDAATGIAQLQAFLRNNPAASETQVQAEVLRLANLVDVSGPQGATTILYSGPIGAAGVHEGRT